MPELAATSLPGGRFVVTLPEGGAEAVEPTVDRGELVGRLASEVRWDDVDRGAIDRIRAALPAAAPLPTATLTAGVPALARAVRVLVVDLLVEQRRLAPGDTDVPAEAAVDLVALLGLPADVVAAIPALQAAAVWERLVAAARIDELPALNAAAGPLGAVPGIVAAVLDRLADPAVGTGTQERRSREQLLAAAVPVAAPAADPRSARLAVALRPGGGVREHAALAAELRSAGVEATLLADHVVARVPAAGLPSPGPGVLLAAETTSHPDAVPARAARLREVLRRADPTDPSFVFDERDHVAERLLLSCPQVHRAIRARVRRVLAGGAPEADLATARVYLREGCDVRATAQTLGLHRETVRYRLGRLGATLGVDLRTWRGRTALLLAVRSERLPEPPTVPAGRPVAERGDRGPVSLGEGVEALAAARRGARASVAADLLADALARAGASASGGALLRAVGAELEDGWAAAGAVRASWPADRCTALVPLAALARRVGDGETIAQAPREALGEALLVGEPSPWIVEGLAAAAGFARGSLVRPAVYRAVTPSLARSVAMDLRGEGRVAIARGAVVLGLGGEEQGAEPTLQGLAGLRGVAAIGELTGVPELAAQVQPLVSLTDVALAAGRRGILDPVDGLLELLLLARPDLAEALQRSVLGPLEDHDASRGVDLVQTLQRHVELDLRRRRTAEDLHLHANSVDHRLAAIARLTGLSFRDPADVLLLQLAVAARRLGHGRPPVAERAR
ncbi:helix-turn-helix domain-containing protein [Paraconexibacter algicola]|uniref:helix-turn-helix domain-containing protein n=1 Tax=Paraconexibacter algicola TaxID=2133960 RepID=UPI0011B1D5E4|nr:helix-turn-helix domain-containing protein [Paraconexibacter algicola]